MFHQPLFGSAATAVTAAILLGPLSGARAGAPAPANPTTGRQPATPAEAPSGSGRPATVGPQWTPLLMRPLRPSAVAVPGVDGRRHLVYELLLTNAGRTPATLEAVEVLDEEAPATVLARFSGSELLSRLRRLPNAAADGLSMPSDASRLVLVDLAWSDGEPAPKRLRHVLRYRGAGGPATGPAVPLQTGGAVLEVTSDLPVLAPPLRGDGWVAINGCCRPDGGHRSTALPIDNQLAFAQRFAIDWMRLDPRGRLSHGDPERLESYASYGADVLAVADGTVVTARDDLPERRPPHLPDPSTIRLDNVLGNHLILRVGPRAHVLYAHLQPGSLRVRPGQMIRRGEVLGLLGNSGNTSAPHLHLHVMAGPDLGSEGLPYGIDRFAFAGTIPESDIEAVYGFSGSWPELRTPEGASPRRGQLPLHLSVIHFPEAPTAEPGGL